MRRLCREAVADGWGAFKTKVGVSVESDVRRCEVMREEIGDVPLMADANQVWDVDEAIAWMRHLEPFDLRWIEEPTSPDDVLGHAAIRRGVAPVGVATGEHVANRVMFKQLLQAEAIDYCQIDACRLGGVNEVLAVLLLAAKFGVPVCPHAGGVGLCEYVQHLSDHRLRVRERLARRSHDRVRRPPARALRRPCGRRAWQVRRADGARVLGRPPAGVDRGALVPRWLALAAMTAPDWRAPRPLGRGGLTVSGLGLGCAAIGNLFEAVADDDARATVDAAWAAGIRYFDTAPLYGHGLSERRLGAALSARPRDDYVVSTKVGRLLRPGGDTSQSIFRDVGDLVPSFDFSSDGVRRSIEESLDRLGLDRIDVALVHDPDDHEAEAMATAFPTLVQLRDEGVVQAIGCGMNQVAMLRRFVERVDLDGVLLAGRHSLLEQRGAEGLLDDCAARSIGVVLGGVFNTGVLVDPGDGSTYDYAPAPPEIVASARAMRERCAADGVALGAAALQFARRHPAVTSVLIGARSAEEIAVDVGFADVEIPDALWSALEAPRYPAALGTGPAAGPRRPTPDGA